MLLKLINVRTATIEARTEHVVEGEIRDLLLSAELVIAKTLGLTDWLAAYAVAQELETQRNIEIGLGVGSAVLAVATLSVAVAGFVLAADYEARATQTYERYNGSTNHRDATAYHQDLLRETCCVGKTRSVSGRVIAIYVDFRAEWKEVASGNHVLAAKRAL